MSSSTSGSHESGRSICLRACQRACTALRAHSQRSSGVILAALAKPPLLAPLQSEGPRRSSLFCAPSGFAPEILSCVTERNCIPRAIQLPASNKPRTSTLKADIVGLSLGAAVGLRTAIQHPEKVRRRGGRLPGGTRTDQVQLGSEVFRSLGVGLGIAAGTFGRVVEVAQVQHLPATVLQIALQGRSRLCPKRHDFGQSRMTEDKQVAEKLSD